MKPTISISTPQFDRPWERDFEYVPQNDEEFYKTIENAPIDTLCGMGFGKWDTIKAVVTQNQQKPISEKIELPAYDSIEDVISIIEGKDVTASGAITFDVGRGDAPVEMPEVDAQILLFPSEWYNKIPDGFMVVGLSGGRYPFERGKTDDDMRFGCLAYGILKPLNQSPLPPVLGMSADSEGGYVYDM